MYMHCATMMMFRSGTSTVATASILSVQNSSKIGDPIRQGTVTYYLRDGSFDSQQATDFLLLAITLMEMYGTIESPQTAMTIEEIKNKIPSIENENVKKLRLLESLVA